MMRLKQPTMERGRRLSGLYTSPLLGSTSLGFLGSKANHALLKHSPHVKSRVFNHGPNNLVYDFGRKVWYRFEGFKWNAVWAGRRVFGSKDAPLNLFFIRDPFFYVSLVESPWEGLKPCAHSVPIRGKVPGEGFFPSGR